MEVTRTFKEVIVRFDSDDWGTGLARHMNDAIKELDKHYRRFDFKQKVWRISQSEYTMKYLSQAYKAWKDETEFYFEKEGNFDIVTWLSQFDRTPMELIMKIMDTPKGERQKYFLKYISEWNMEYGLGVPNTHNNKITLAEYVELAKCLQTT